MALETLTHKVAETGNTYSYQHAAPRGSKPYLLFLHGFPESSYDWHSQTAYFADKGFGIICPDLLGYGSTDKPKELKEYRVKKMDEEILSIVDKHGIDKVIGVGHDWGSSLLGGLATFFRQRFLAFAFLAVGYRPAASFNLDAINAATEKILGYPSFAYWHLFNSPDMEALFDRNPDSTTSLFFNQQPRHWQTWICNYDKGPEWFEQGKVEPLPSWYTDEIRRNRDAKIKQSGWTGGLSYYRAMMAGLNDADNEVPEDKKRIDDIPVLFVGAEKEDDVLPSWWWEKSMSDSCNTLTIKRVNAGHWMMLEAPDACNEALGDFIGALSS